MTEEAIDESKRQAEAHEADRWFWSSLNATASLFRWILASLITLNGGALIALASSHTSFEPAGFANAMMSFFIGCGLAVVAAGCAVYNMLSITLIALDQQAALRGVDLGQRGQRLTRTATFFTVTTSFLAWAAFMAGGFIAADSYRWNAGPDQEQGDSALNAAQQRIPAGSIPSSPTPSPDRTPSTPRAAGPDWTQSEQAMIDEWMEFNSRCRGGTDPDEVAVACERRDGCCPNS